MQKSALDPAVDCPTPLAKQFPNGQQKPARAPSRIDSGAVRSQMKGQTSQEGRDCFALSQGLTEALKELSEQEHVDLFVTLLATFQILLARYGKHEIEGNMPIIAGFQGLAVGNGTFRSSATALGACLFGDPTFRELLRRVREIYLTASRHCNMRPKAAAIKMQPDGDTIISQVRQVYFAMHESVGQNVDEQEPRPDRDGSERVGSELGLFVSEEKERLEGVVEYDGKLFESSAIERLVRHYAALLQSVVDNSDQHLATLQLLTQAERHQQLVEWNDTKRAYPENLCVHQLFEAQAQKTPNAVAVVFGNQQLTYREINAQANRVARYLRKQGVKPDTLVGLCVERSPGMLVGILAILKAGGAYVPLDPIHPNKRLSAILSEAQPRVLLTQRHLISRFPEYSRLVFVIDQGLASVMGESSENLSVELAPENLAYVNFTSGSTGIPKGVLVSHRSLINHSTAMARQYYLQPSDRVLQFASIGFDVAAEEIFPTWLSGAAVVLWSAVAAIKDFLEFIEQQEITVLNLPAPYWHEWVSESEQIRIPPMVRLVVVGSDKVSTEKVSIWKQQIGDRVRLYTAYGPTETTVTATIYDPRGNNRYGVTCCVPFGRPIANVKAYVLDQKLNLVPIGVPGELHIGGVGIARGYLNRPALTAERFIPNPFSRQPGERLYKTGDLARYRADGNIEFVGRIDNYVKLRGFRIELGDIEGTLAQHPGVQRVVVLDREVRPGDKQLVAYVVTKKGVEVARQELSGFLRDRLPGYMVPAEFVFLDRIPLTANGKVERGGLPVPHGSGGAAVERFVAPRDKMESRLKKIWQEVLGVQSVGLWDDFFELGGHSLLAMRLLARVEKEFNRSVSLAVFFDGPTVEGLAATLRGEGIVLNWTWFVRLQPVGSNPPLFLLHGSRELAHQIGTDQPIYGARPHGFDGRRVPLSVQEMAADYLAELRTIQAEGPYFIGGYSFGGLVAIELAQQLTAQGQEVRLLVLLDPTLPTDGRTDPVAGTLLRTGIPSSIERVRTHRSAFSFLEGREKLRHMMTTIRWKFDSAKNAGKMMVCRGFLLLGRRVPERLRMFYFLEASSEVARNYVPGVCPLSAVLLRTANREPLTECPPQFLSGPLEVYEMPGNHLDVIRGPHLQTWAERVRACLQSARN